MATGLPMGWGRGGVGGGYNLVFLLFSSFTLFVFSSLSSSSSRSLLFPRFDCLLIAHLFVFLLPPPPPHPPPPSLLLLLLCLSPLDVPPLLTGVVVVALTGPVLQWQDQLQGNV